MYIYCACVTCTYNGVLTTLLHGTVQYKDGQYNGIKVIAIKPPFCACALKIIQAHALVLRRQ